MRSETRILIHFITTVCHQVKLCVLYKMKLLSGDSLKRFSNNSRTYLPNKINFTGARGVKLEKKSSLSFSSNLLKVYHKFPEILTGCRYSNFVCVSLFNQRKHQTRVNKNGRFIYRKP